MKGFYYKFDLDEMLDENPLFLLITGCNLLIYFAMLVLSLLFDHNRFVTSLLFASFLLAAVFFVAEKKKSRGEGAVLLFLTSFYIILFPLTYLANCNEAKDMPLFFMLGIIITAVLLTGKKRTLVILIEVAAYTASFLYEVLYMQHQTAIVLPGVVYVRLLAATLLTGCIGGILLRYRNRMLLDHIRKSIDEEELARQANYVRDLFMTNVSHEIRKPLQTITETSRMLLGFDLDSQRREDIFYIENAAVRLSAVVDKIEGHARKHLQSPEAAEEGDAEQFFESILQTAKQSTEKEGLPFTCPEAVVMVVDDNVINREIICSILEQYQCLVLTAASGEECLELLKTQRTDIIFLDYMMPEMDGVETLKQIKHSDHENQNIVIVALTANEESGAKEFFLQAGFDDYIPKPINRRILHQVLRRGIGADKREEGGL